MPQITLPSNPPQTSAPAQTQALPGFEVEHNMYRGSDLYFYHFPENRVPTVTPPLLFQSLLSQATSSIKIWDPYFHIINSSSNPGRDWQLFQYVNSDVDVTLLCMGSTQKFTPVRWNDTVTRIKTYIPDKSGISFTLAYINKDDSMDSKFWEFHDRYLIIDDSIVALVGASLTDHVAEPNKSSSMVMINDEKDRSLIMELFKLYHKKAKDKGSTYFANLYEEA